MTEQQKFNAIYFKFITEYDHDFEQITNALIYSIIDLLDGGVSEKKWFESVVFNREVK